MPAPGYVKIRLKQDRYKEEWRLLYRTCKDTRLKERYHCMLLSFDYSWKEIAEILQHHYRSILHWVDCYNSNGMEGLILGKAKGKDPKLTPQQQSIVASAVLRGPQSEGLPFSNWDTKSLATWIQEKFRVKLSREAVRQLLRKLGFSWHKPEHRYVKTDPDAQTQFVQNLRTEVKHLGSTDAVVFCDECSLNHHPRLHRTWLPKGLCSIVSTFGTHAKRHVYGAVNVITGRLLYRVAEKLRAVEFVALLEKLLRIYPGRRILLVLDSGKTHTAKVVQKFLAEIPLIRLLWLPPYSPRLNPVEQLWKELRAKVTSNQFFNLIDSMVSAVTGFFECLTRRTILKLCSADYLLGLR